MGHALLCLLTAAIVLVPVGIQGRERPENEPVVTDEDLLLCLVQLAGTTLSRDLMTYMVHGGNMLLPLEGIGRLLELGIRSDPSAQQAGGHVARPGQDFMLDIGNGIVSVSGKARTFDPSRIAVLQDDIYVESKLLGEWLSMHIDANRLESSINIKPFEPLPCNSDWPGNDEAPIRGDTDLTIQTTRSEKLPTVSWGTCNRYDRNDIPSGE